MIKDVVSKLDFSLCDEIAILLFGVAFISLCLGAFLLKKESIERFRQIPISDDVLDPK